MMTSLIVESMLENVKQLMFLLFLVVSLCFSIQLNRIHVFFLSVKFNNIPKMRQTCHEQWSNMWFSAHLHNSV